MKTLRFFCFKMADVIDLEKIAAYFKTNRPLKWVQHIYLDNAFIEWGLNTKLEEHYCFIYEFGTICFVNFYEDEMRQFLALIDKIEPVNYTYFSQMFESYRLYQNEHLEFVLYKGGKKIVVDQADMVAIVAGVISKSVALNHVENLLQQLMDVTEPILNKMSKGYFKSNRQTMVTFGKMIVFKFQLIRHIKIFERANTVKEAALIKQACDAVADHFELDDRYDIIDKKLDELKNIADKYYTFSHSKNEQRLYIFEAIMLGMFPLVSFINQGYLDKLLNWFSRLI